MSKLLIGDEKISKISNLKVRLHERCLRRCHQAKTHSDWVRNCAWAAGRHDIQLNDTQHNHILRIGIIYDTQHTLLSPKMTQHNSTLPL
jgi:hypothetical protein